MDGPKREHDPIALPLGGGPFGDSAELLAVVVDHALAAVITMDDRGKVTGWGRRAEACFGWTPKEAIGRELVALIVPPQYRLAHNAGLARYRETGEGPVLGRIIELSALHRSGREFPVELAISPATTVAGGPPSSPSSSTSPNASRLSSGRPIYTRRQPARPSRSGTSQTSLYMSCERPSPLRGATPRCLWTGRSVHYPSG